MRRERRSRASRRPTPIDEYATANAAQFAITRARFQQPRSARVGAEGQAPPPRGSAGSWSRGHSEGGPWRAHGRMPPDRDRSKIPSATVPRIIRNIAGRRGPVRDCQKRMVWKRASPSVYDSTSSPSPCRDQALDAVSNLVADRTHPLGRQSLRVGNVPIVAFRTGYEGARLAAAHRDQEGRLGSEVRGEETGACPRSGRCRLRAWRPRPQGERGQPVLSPPRSHEPWSDRTAC